MLSRHSDNLNKTLQHDKLLAAEGQAIAVMINTTLASLQNDAHYHLLWQKVIAMAKGNNVKDPKLPRNAIGKDLLDMKTVMLQQGSVPLQNSIPVPFH